MEPDATASNLVKDNWREPHPRRAPTLDEIREYKQEVLDLNKRLESMVGDTDNSARLRLELERERANLQSFIAPFNRLPTEILSEIARYGVRLRISRFTLSQISSSMRDAVIGFKTLWSTIVVTSPAERTEAPVSSRNLIGLSKTSLEPYLLCKF